MWRRKWAKTHREFVQELTDHVREAGREAMKGLQVALEARGVPAPNTVRMTKPRLKPAA